MELASFEEYVGISILQRGRVYFEGGHIESLEEVEKDAWIGTVVGSEENTISLEVDKNAGKKNGSKVCMVFIKEVTPIITYADDSSG